MININTLWGPELLDLETKKCVICKKDKVLTDYAKHKHAKDGLDSRCRKCVKEQSKIRSRLKKSAPPKPDVCECCGINPEEKQYRAYWVLDHDHKTNTFRGWLCDECNLGIGKLGDNLDGVMKAVRYLKND